MTEPLLCFIRVLNESQVNLTNANIGPYGSNIRFRKHITALTVSVKCDDNTTSGEFLVVPISSKAICECQQCPKVGAEEKREKPDSSTNNKRLLDDISHISNTPNLHKGKIRKMDTSKSEQPPKISPNIWKSPDSVKREGTFECGGSDSDCMFNSDQSTSEECESLHQTTLVTKKTEAPVDEPLAPQIVNQSKGFVGPCKCSHVHLPPRDETLPQKDEMDVSEKPVPVQPVPVQPVPVQPVPVQPVPVQPVPVQPVPVQPVPVQPVPVQPVRRNYRR